MGGFWLHPVSFFLTGFIVLAGTQSEYYRVVRKTGGVPLSAPGMVVGAAAYVLSTLAASGRLPLSSLLAIIPMMAAIYIIGLYRKNSSFISVAHTLFPLLYIVLPFSLFPFAAWSQKGIPSLVGNNEAMFSPSFVIGFFILLWANDTGAYLSGMAFGRHKLMQRISPKKTWEGFAGGIIISAGTAWLLSGWLRNMDPVHWMIISLVISVTGTYGDLVESMLKREAQVKDSGSILPGHGGFLDRFDSTLVSFPLVFLLLILFGY